MQSQSSLNSASSRFNQFDNLNFSQADLDQAINQLAEIVEKDEKFVQKEEINLRLKQLKLASIQEEEQRIIHNIRCLADEINLFQDQEESSPSPQSKKYHRKTYIEELEEQRKTVYGSPQKVEQISDRLYNGYIDKRNKIIKMQQTRFIMETASLQEKPFINEKSQHLTSKNNRPKQNYMNIKPKIQPPQQVEEIIQPKILVVNKEEGEQIINGFLQKQQKWVEQKKIKMQNEQMKQMAEELAGIKFKPETCEKSKHIYEKKFQNLEKADLRLQVNYTKKQDTSSPQTENQTQKSFMNKKSKQILNMTSKINPNQKQMQSFIQDSNEIKQSNQSLVQFSQIVNNQEAPKQKSILTSQQSNSLYQNISNDNKNSNIIYDLLNRK